MAENDGADVGRSRIARFVPLALLLLVAAALKIHYQVRYCERDPLADAPYGDSVIFLEEAQRHFGPASGAEAGGPIAFYKSPLYTALVFVTGADEAAGRAIVRALQTLLGLVILGCVYRMAARRGGIVAGTIALLLALTYAPLTAFESKLLDTTIGLALLVVACDQFDRLASDRARIGSACGAGAAFGCAALARAGNLAAFALACVALVVDRRSRRLVLAFCATGALVIAPIAIHNWRASRAFIPVSYSEGSAFLQGNGPEARGLLTNPPGWADGVVNERLEEQRVARAALGHEPSAGEQRDVSYRAGWAFLRADPGRIPGLLLDKLRFAISAYEVGDNDSLRRERERFGLLPWARLPFTVLLALGLFGLGASASRGKRALFVPLIAGVAALLLYYVSSRYRLPLAPFLAIAAGDGIAAVLAGRVDRTRFACGVAASAVVVLLLVFVELPYSAEDLARSERLFDRFLDEHARRAGGGR